MKFLHEAYSPIHWSALWSGTIKILESSSAMAIISEEYLKATYPDQEIQALTREYKENTKGTVILTFGHKEILYGSREEDYRAYTPFEINPVDTTGAGDSFRAGIIYGLLKKSSIGKTIEFASALAAIVCQSIPGVINSPSYNQVKSFIASITSKI